MSERQRASLLLVARGLFDTRAKADAAIAAGRVSADGQLVRKPAELLAMSARLVIEPFNPWVSRGGLQLAAALERYPIDAEGHVCLDIGAASGGFSEVLLNAGASLVFAMESGRGLLHPSLRGHPQLVSLENTDIRSYQGKRLPQRPDVVVIDVSDISLKQVLPIALTLAAAPMKLLALIKPQFEAPPAAITKGVVQDATVQRAVCDDIAAFAAAQGCTEIAVFPSAILGSDGNNEFFLGARRG